MREPARSSERVDLPAGAVPEATEPGVRAKHRGDRRAVEQFDRRPQRRPLLHTLLCELEASRRMHRLNPASLLCLGADRVLSHKIEQVGGAVAQEGIEALACFTVPAL